MALVVQLQPASRGFRQARCAALIAGCLVLGACSQSAPQLSAPNLLAQAEAEAAYAAQDGQATRTQTELEKATAWWGKKYAANPQDLEAALSFARNLKAMGEKKRALAVLQQASVYHGNSHQLAGEYGRLALEFDQISLADRLLAAADDPTRPDWRIVSARGTVLAKQGKFADAIPYFERARSLSNDQPSVMSNLALAHAMNGDPHKAESLLRRAAATGSSQKIRQNLALVLGLQGKYDEAKLLASQDVSPETAAENTEVLRRIVKLEPKSIPSPARRNDTQFAEAAPQPAVAHAEIPRADVADLDDTDINAPAANLAHLAQKAAPARIAMPALPVRKPGIAQPQIAQASAPAILDHAQKATTAKAMVRLNEPTTTHSRPEGEAWASQVALSERRKH